MQLINTLKEWIEADIKPHLVSKTTQKKRMSICKECEMYRSLTAQCGHCECFLKIKTWLKFDPIESMMSDDDKRVEAHCPFHKW